MCCCGCSLLCIPERKIGRRNSWNCVLLVGRLAPATLVDILQLRSLLPVLLLKYLHKFNETRLLRDQVIKTPVVALKSIVCPIHKLFDVTICITNVPALQDW